MTTEERKFFTSRPAFVANINQIKLLRQSTSHLRRDQMRKHALLLQMSKPRKKKLILLFFFSNLEILLLSGQLESVVAAVRLEDLCVLDAVANVRPPALARPQNICSVGPRPAQQRLHLRHEPLAIGVIPCNHPSQKKKHTIVERCTIPLPQPRSELARSWPRAPDLLLFRGTPTGSRHARDARSSADKKKKKKSEFFGKDAIHVLSLRHKPTCLQMVLFSRLVTSSLSPALRLRTRP